MLLHLTKDVNILARDKQVTPTDLGTLACCVNNSILFMPFSRKLQLFKLGYICN